MSELLLVNPRRRKRKARRANPRRKRRSAKRRRNPGFALPMVNPRRRKRRAARRRNPSGRRRRNPGLRLSVGGIQGQVMSAVPGAFGALALDIAYGYLPIPATLKGGMLGFAVKGAAAIALGMVASKVVKGSTAAKMTEGALTVMLHGFMKGLTTQFAPQIRMGDYEGPGWNPDGAMDAYLPGQFSAPDVEASPVGEYLNAYDEAEYQ